MTGFDPDAGRFFFYLLTLFLVGIAFNAFFRFLSFLAPNVVSIAVAALPCG